MKTVSLELSKQLKDAGYPQESYFWWRVYDRTSEKEPHVVSKGEYERQYREPIRDYIHIASPLADEILDRLPFAVYIKKRTKKREFWFIVERLSHGWWLRYQYGKETIAPVIERSITEAAARCWLSLKKENLL